MLIFIQALSALFLAKFIVGFLLSLSYEASDESLKSSELYTKFNLQNAPLVTILIPAWNEEIGIIPTIKSVLDSTYKNIEILVINDGSKDNTSQVAKDFINSLKETDKVKSKVIDQVNGGKASALNNGIQNANGKYILTIDADSYLDSKAIELMLKKMELIGADYICGKPVVGNPDNLISILQYYEYEYACESRKAQSLMNAIYILPGCISMFRKSLLIELNGFPTDNIIEDIPMTRKIHFANKYKGAYEHYALIYTEAPTTFSQLVRQRTRWRISNWTSLWQYRKSIFNFHLPFWYSIIELPWSIIVNIVIFLFPIIFIFSSFPFFYQNQIRIENLLFAIAIYLVYSLIFVYPTFANIGKNLKSHKLVILLLPLINLFVNLLTFVEFYGSLKAIKKMSNDKTKLAWDGLERKGLKTSKKN